MHSFTLGLHTTVFQVEIYAIKECVIWSTETGYIGRNIYILSDSQANIKGLDNFQTNDKSVCNCHQSLMKLAEHKRCQKVRVPGHMEIDRNEIAEQLAK
jgi:ribonuclease HI